MDEAMTAVADELAIPAIETQEQSAAPTETEGPVDLDAEVSTETEEETAETETEANAEESEQAEEETPEGPELVDIEVNGKTYKVPADLKDGYLMQADYTRKTQEVAALRKESESLKEQAAALYQTSQEYIDAKAAVRVLEGQLQQYQNVNWDQMEQEDPIGAQSHWRRFHTLKEQYQQGTQYLQNADAQRTAKAEQDIANRLQETRKFAQEKIPGYSIDLENKVVEFATKELGFDIEQIRASINPAIFKTMHLAWLGSQSLQKQQTAPRPAAPTQPLKTVSSKASPVVTKNPEDMSMEEYARWRSSQAKR